MEKQHLSLRQLRLEHMERQRIELAQRNPEYGYICDKKYPDPALPYRTWIKKIISENGI
jgi:hypothetical protein